MNKQKIARTIIAAAAIALLYGPAHGQTREDLQHALDEARAAAAQAQAAAAAAQAALEKVQAQAAAAASDAAAAKEQAKTVMNPPVVPAVTPTANGGLYFNGSIDAGYRVTRDSDHTKNVNAITGSNASTSLILFRAYRKLPSDMTAYFNLELDLNPVQSSSATQGPGAQAFFGTPFTGEQYAALAGNFGLVQIGEPNAHMFVVTNASQPFLTGLGSGISPTFGRFGTNNIAGITNSNDVAPARIVRHEKDIKYTTPAFAGFRGVFEYAAKNSNSSAATANSNGYVEAGAQYNSGPLNVYYSWTKETAAARGAAAPVSAVGTTPAVGLPAGTSIVFNGVSANYTLGDATLYAGFTTTKHDAPTPLEKSKSWNIAGKYNLTPQADVAFNLLRRDSEITNQPDTTFVGLGADYFLDKQTSLYVRGEYWKLDATGVAPTLRHGAAATGVRYVF